MKTAGIRNIGITTGMVGASASATTLAITPDLILTYLSIICMFVSLFTTIVLFVFKIKELVKEKKYKEIEKEVKVFANDLSNKANQIEEQIEKAKEVKK